MDDPLLTYLNDHLSGARFAVSLLEDLSEQKNNIQLSAFSADLLTEIEEDQVALTNCVTALGGGPSMLKEATAWIAQKAGKAKLDVTEPLGQFEAVEMLMLGVSGKLALWDALSEISQDDLTFSESDLRRLAQRAVDQRNRLEARRLELAKRALN